MELALLGRPIGSNNYANERQNPPLDWKDNALTKVAMDDKDAASDTYSKVEYYNQTCIAPHGLYVLLGNVDLVKQSSSVTRLSLSRPAESKSPGSRAPGVYVTVQTDVSILKEWATSYVPPGTLSNTSSSTHAPSRRKLRWTLPVAQSSLRFIPTVQAGYKRFVVHCLPALLEENAQWPRLKSIRLPMVEVQFKLLGVDVRSGLRRRMVYDDNDDQISRGGVGFGGDVALGEEEEEEEEEDEEEPNEHEEE
ncbi:hypothetical protein B0H14DRAFT_3454467 [Mycena olivaceomarginata]|nr:hypothetical protein B0H14DRAFT_3454467 [Mycena olivaceomarginata]